MYKKILIITLLLLALTISSLFAEKSLERIANEKGVEAETLYNNKKLVEAAQTFEAAISKLEEAVKIDGIPLDNEKISKWLGSAFQGYFQGKKFEDALRILDRQLELDPTNYTYFNYKAIILKKYLKRVDEAIVVLKKYNFKKRTFKVEKKIALYYSDLEDYENALIWYHKAYEQKKDATVIKNIAVIYRKLGRNSEAITAYEDFIKTNPNESVLARTYMNLGKLYEDMKNDTKSNENYEKSIKLKYNSNIVHVLIRKYYDGNSYDKALEKIALLLTNKPDNSEAIYYRAMIHYNRGENEAATADFQIISSDPKFSKEAKGYIESIKSE
ncbi:MAG: tetratricopeptide repeat protein [Candidatus Cloacimonetes bacterium]|nr:tetratricopeptide repeat protein [Candidatus Cloacimonadota bacterium]